MITPSFGLTATERVLPKLALDFTTAILDPRVTFTRSGNTATYTNSSGVIAAINADLPRFDYNPVTLACQGLLIEEARTNLLLNSLINGTILSTQIVTTSATPYTLSFYGTGTITLAGSAIAIVTGTGVYPSRKTYTFTPTAGALTCTVTGSVQYAQLEAGSFATSFIPTSVASVTRNADVATMTGANFSSWFNATQGTFAAVANTESAAGSTQRILSASTGSYADSISMSTSGANVYFQMFAATALQTNLFFAGGAGNTSFKLAGAYKANSQAGALKAGTVSTATGATVPTVNQLGIGSEGGLALFNGWIQSIRYWPQRLINAEVQAFSK